MPIEYELIKVGIFRILRCPKCKSNKVTTITVFEYPAKHRCLDCGNVFSDLDVEGKLSGTKEA